MTAHYEPVSRWNIPRGVVDTTLRGIRRAGMDNLEGGAFWLGRRESTSMVRTVVLLEGPGVAAGAGYFEVSPMVFGQVGVWAADREQVLLAVVHSHWGETATLMSPTDRRGAVHVPDVLTVIVPGFGRVTDPSRWGFHRYVPGGTFVELGADEQRARIEWTDDRVAVMVGNKDGVLDG